MILAFDTSLPMLSVAIVEGERVEAALSVGSEGSRNEKLLPAVDWLLHESGRTLDDIHLFAVTRGPGSFTGVRIALATAQGLAMAKQKPIFALSTHAAAAASRRESSVLVHSDGGRSEYYVSGFRDGAEVVAASLMTKDQLDETKREFEFTLDLSSSLDTMNLAMWAALSAARVGGAGQLSGYADLTPVYVRLAEAEVKLQQRRDG